MTNYPIFYFCSKKETPKTYLQINLKTNQNCEPCVEVDSNLNLEIKIDDKEYIIELTIISKNK